MGPPIRGTSSMLRVVVGGLLLFPAAAAAAEAALLFGDITGKVTARLRTPYSWGKKRMAVVVSPNSQVPQVPVEELK